MDQDVPERMAGDDAFAGMTIGRYRVLRTLGSGGMGVVVLAERADRHFHQQVAIKLVRSNMLSRPLEARLKAEREILATLNHPCIAKLLDGGVTEDGTPYIVMEYVDGEPIDTYCDRRKLDLRQRLQLFQKVCGAVHSAHQRLVVHRDLKPSNILVTADGTPKLLDFGIAKVLDDRYTLHTLAVTQADVRLMTPDHASPEQIQGEAVTTASDIYVLGVLLYELLTGRRPFNFSTMRLGEIERAICEQTPVAPSAVVVTQFSAYTREELEALATMRATSPAKLRKELRGDLDNVILMAMRKEPERRYRSVEQMARDIENFLGALPVLARGDAFGYRAQKFVRRHAGSVTLAALLLVSLVAFSVMAVTQAQRVARERDLANEQRIRAEQQQQKAEAVSNFLVQIFESSDPENARGHEITARELLERGSRKLEREMEGQPALLATLDETIGQVYVQLGLFDSAEAHLERALRLRREPGLHSAADVASAYASLARLRQEQGRLADGENAARQALALFGSTGVRSATHSATLQQLGSVLFELGKYAEAERVLRISLEELRTRPADERRMIEVMNALGATLHARGDTHAAIDLYSEALAILEKKYGDSHPQSAFVLHNLARAIQDAGDLTRAEQLSRRALAAHEQVLGPEHPETLDAVGALGTLLQTKGDLEGAETLFLRALASDRKVRGPDHLYVGHDLSQLGALAIQRNDARSAERYFREALAIFEKSLEPNHPFRATGQANLGRSLVDQQRFQEALPVLRAAVAAEVAAFGTEHDIVAIARISLARALAGVGRTDEARPLFESSYAALLRTRGPGAPAAISARTWITDFYRSIGKPEAAEQLFAQVSSVEH